MTIYRTCTSIKKIKSLFTVLQLIHQTCSVFRKKKIEIKNNNNSNMLATGNHPPEKNTVKNHQLVDNLNVFYCWFAKPTFTPYPLQLRHHTSNFTTCQPDLHQVDTVPFTNRYLLYAVWLRR